MSQETMMKMTDAILGSGSYLLQDIKSLSAPVLAQIPSLLPNLRLMRVEEINDEKTCAYRNALANVYATLEYEQGVQFIYLLDCSLEGVSLYFGVSQLQPNADGHEALKNFRGALEGQLPGINLSTLDTHDVIIEHLQQSRYQGVVLGIPTGQSEEQSQQEEDFQGIERLVRTLLVGSSSGTQNSARWQMAVVTQPLTRDMARSYLDGAYDLASELALLVKTSVQAGSNNSEQKGVSVSEGNTQSRNEGSSDTRGKTEGASETKTDSSPSSSGKNRSVAKSTNDSINTSVAKTTGTGSSTNQNESHNLNHSSGNNLGVTKEITDKRAQHLLDHIEKSLIPRLQKGVTKGLFGSSIYVAADTASTYRRLKNTLCATYQGGEITVSPLEVLDLKAASAAQILQLPHLAEDIDPKAALFHSVNGSKSTPFGNLLTTDELALIAGLPRHELPGLRRRKTVEFIVDLPRINVNDALDLGEVIERGRKQRTNRVSLNKADFNKHIFVTGVTGAGKTTTCLNLLIESALPFLVIEPAKTEYRALHQHMPGQVDYYRPNGDDHRCLRLNPFALVHPKQKIKSHASFLRNVFAAVFPMEASMPYLVEQAILRAYEEKGWDLSDNSCLLGDDPFEPALRAWPTMSDMIRQLDTLIPEQGMGKEFEEKYRGSLVSRLTSLTHGVLGDILDVPQSLDFDALLTRNVVVELEEIKDGEGKALMMALLLGSISEAIRYRHGKNSAFRHLTLVEEAHRLLSRPEPGDKARAMAVDAFSDLLAEVRKYGEGLIIADQIPAKLVPDVIKNTHTKIVHRLFAEDDRRAMGEAMMMDDDQRDYLPNLATGEAVIFCGGWHGPTHAAIRADLAQTDGQILFDEDVEALAIDLLCRERARYYPSLTHLGWLNRDEDKELFADFVRSTRKAFQLLLSLNPKSGSDIKTTPLHKQYKAKAFKQWLERWQPIAIHRPVSDSQWLAWSDCTKPGQPLTAMMLAVIRDANPLVRTNAKIEMPWPFPLAEMPLWCDALDELFALLAKSNADEFVTQLNKTSSRLLIKVLDVLRFYQ
ncbi:DUF87 domain-containing protein [Aeromonas caviae]|uniref:ATP-binding protein n=1 Tax=Aeromonas caviae TaxID=648 RepID=UPI0029DCE1D5|nr:DUF87 domain-containing protein [Aeromonas caviae]MDX7760820.1 DUF87 domain-containing protein [Aeromonas caviae]